MRSPLEKNDNPELDNSESANEGHLTEYMHMIGQLQWAVTLRRFDILPMQCQCHSSDLLPKDDMLRG